MPTLSTFSLQSLREEQPPPPWQWPEFHHPAPITVAALALVLILVSIMVSILWQIIRLRLAQRRGFVLIEPQLEPEPMPTRKITKKLLRPISTTSELEIETRQLLFGDCATTGERMPLRSTNDSCRRASLYDTFQITPLHATRLKVSRSMMELNGGSPLEANDSTEDMKKAKTIHWHGVNKLNTAWAWML